MSIDNAELAEAVGAELTAEPDATIDLTDGLAPVIDLRPKSKPEADLAAGIGDVDTAEAATTQAATTQAGTTQAGTAEARDSQPQDEIRRAEISARLAEIFEPEPQVDPDELSRRDADMADESGRRALVRAGMTAGVGGGIIALVSMAFGPRFFATDIRALGMFVGLAIVALGIVAPIGSTTRKTVPGALIIVCAVLAFPIAAGGYFLGSLISIVGGAMLVAYEPPADDVVVVTRKAGRVRRMTALFIDFMAAFIIHRVLYAMIPVFFGNTFNVIIAWLFCWTLVAIVPAIWTRRTPGRIFMVLRSVDKVTLDRAMLGSAVLRELLRGTIAIGGFMAVGQIALRNGFAMWAVFVAVITLIGIGFVAERFRLLDRVTGTVSVHDEVIVGDADGEAGADTDTAEANRVEIDRTP